MTCKKKFEILTAYRNGKLNVPGKIVPRYKMIKCHHRLTISLSSYAAYNQKKWPSIIFGNCFYCFCFSFFEFRSLLCPVCNLTLSRKGHSKENGNDYVFQRERLLKLVPSYFLLVKPNSIIFIEIESFFVSLIKDRTISRFLFIHFYSVWTDEWFFR